MTTQHRDIPDAELHGIKGASTALFGAVPVANGSGGTVFQKISTSSLAGSVAASIANLTIVTDGSGGFKSETVAYALIRIGMAPGAGSTVVWSSEAYPLTSGFTLSDPGAVQVTVSGFYWFHTDIKVFGVGETPMTPPVGPHPVICNADTGAVVIPNKGGLVYLSTGIRYRLNYAGDLSLWRVFP